MGFPLIIEPEAEEDISKAYEWYEAKRLGLRQDFLQCVEKLFQRLSTSPEVHAIV